MSSSKSKSVERRRVSIYGEEGASDLVEVVDAPTGSGTAPSDPAAPSSSSLFVANSGGRSAASRKADGSPPNRAVSKRFASLQGLVSSKLGGRPIAFKVARGQQQQQQPQHLNGHSDRLDANFSSLSSSSSELQPHRGPPNSMAAAAVAMLQARRSQGAATVAATSQSTSRSPPRPPARVDGASEAGSVSQFDGSEARAMVNDVVQDALEDVGDSGAGGSVALDDGSASDGEMELSDSTAEEDEAVTPPLTPVHTVWLQEEEGEGYEDGEPGSPVRKMLSPLSSLGNVLQSMQVHERQGHLSGSTHGEPRDAPTTDNFNDTKSPAEHLDDAARQLRDAQDELRSFQDEMEMAWEDDSQFEDETEEEDEVDFVKDEGEAQKVGNRSSVAYDKPPTQSSTVFAGARLSTANDATDSRGASVAEPRHSPSTGTHRGTEARREWQVREPTENSQSTAKIAPFYRAGSHMPSEIRGSRAHVSPPQSRAPAAPRPPRNATSPSTSHTIRPVRHGHTPAAVGQAGGGRVPFAVPSVRSQTAAKSRTDANVRFMGEIVSRDGFGDESMSPSSKDDIEREFFENCTDPAAAIEAMQTQMEDPRMQSRGCHALARLCAASGSPSSGGTDFRAVILAEGGVQVLSDVLKKHARVAEVLSSALRAAAFLARENHTCCTRLHLAGFATFGLQALRCERNSGHVVAYSQGVQAEACSLLRALAWGGMIPQLSIIRAGGVSTLLDIVRMCVHDLATLHKSLGGRNPAAILQDPYESAAAASLRSGVQEMQRLQRRRQQQQHLERWELKHSDHGRLMEHALAALGHIAKFRDGNPPPLLSVSPFHDGHGAPSSGLTVMTDALLWASIFAEEYGSRRHELVQVSLLESLYEVASDFGARSQLRDHVNLFEQVLRSASDAMDAAASIEDEGAAEERHYARAVAGWGVKLLRRLREL